MTQSKEYFKCKHSHCEESALSLSEHCWGHLESKADYPAKLGHYLAGLGNKLVCVEAFSGPFMIGLYIFTLTRRYATT
ncbi:MAG: hypothetical protein AUJ72_00215 [Candidatus Omnitrophica bacterium CG1_02_46_14]|nr:MAG: hypothetical protein AUJ72_00215 [Candidatus Omnitrophica bacterium CG1_02_46_14]